MKKLNLSLFIISGSLLAACAVGDGANQRIMAANDGAKAASTFCFTEKIVDLSKLKDGDKVILMNIGNQGLDYFGGNSVYPHYTDVGFYFSNDERFCGIENSNARLFDVSKEGNYYSFATNLAVYGSNYDVLLAYNNDRRSAVDGLANNVPSFDGGFGVYTNTEAHKASNNCKRTLSLNSSSYDYGCNVAFTNVANTSLSVSFNVYKVIDASQYEVFNAASKFDQRDYYIGERINLSGVEVDVALKNTEEYATIKYNEDPSLFYFDDGEDIVRDPEISRFYNFRIRGINFTDLSVLINSAIPNPGYEYNLLQPNTLNDYRGTYLLVEQEEGGHYFDASKESFDRYTSNSYSCTVTNGNLVNQESYAMVHGAITIEKKVINGNNEYVGRNVNGKYLCKTSGGSFLYFSDTLSADNILTIESNKNGGLQIGFKQGSSLYGFSYDTTYKCFFFERNDYYQNARLYKIGETSEFRSDIETFRSFADTNLGEFVATGDEAWNNLKAQFNSLGADAQGYLANLTYSHGTHTKGDIENIIDRYDYAVARYNYEDFIGRKEYASFGNVVEGIISDIGTVTLEKEDLIIDARAAYERLNNEQKAEVGNLNVLEAAEKRITAVKVENKVTRSSIAFHYSKDDLGNFTFSNVYLRFGGIISKDLWDELDEKYGIVAYGELYSNDAYLGSNELKNYYNSADEINVKKSYFELTEEASSYPVLFNNASYQGVTDNYYVWNLRRSVAEDDFKTVYASVAYIVTNEGEVVFLTETRKSVKNIAQDLLDSGDYDDESLDGSIKYLADF